MNENEEDVSKLQSELNVKNKRQSDLAQLKYQIQNRTDPGQLGEKLAKLRFIKQLKNEISYDNFLELMNELNYQFTEQYQMIYKSGESSKKFYIILDGSVAVMKPKEQLVGSEAIEEEEKEQDQLKFKQLPPPQPDQIVVDPIQHIRETYAQFNIVKILKVGSHFGEVSLKLDSSHLASVIAITDCHLIWLSANTFKKIIEPYFSDILDRKIELIRSNYVFKDTPQDQFMGIVLELELETYMQGQIIYQQGQKAQHIYFIAKGSIYLERDKQVKLASYSDSQMFGYVECLNKTPRYASAIVGSPRITVYKISRNRFLDNLGSFKVYETLKKNSIQLQQTHDTLYQGILNKRVSNELNTNINSKQYQNKIIEEKIMNQHIQNNLKQYQYITENNSHYRESTDLNEEERVQIKRDVLQKIYCNSVHNYFEHICDGRNKQKNDEFLRSPLNSSRAPTKSLVSLTPMTGLSLNNSMSQAFIQLPKEPQNIQTIIEKVSQLPRIQRDNFVERILHQSALQSRNPKVEARKITQSMQRAHDKALRRPKKQEQRLSLHSIDNGLKLLQVLNLPKILQRN